MSVDTGGNCWNCGTALAPSDYTRGDSCPACGRDTKTCRGCEFYDRGSNNDCREPQAERVLEKERSNFCDYFRPSSRATLGKGSVLDEARAAAEALFGKKKG
jgi:hypothetical protein